MFGIVVRKRIVFGYYRVETAPGSLARLRTGRNQLPVNRLKGRVPRQNRLCKYCIQLNKNHVEGEFHFVMNCPLYRELRNTYLME